MSTQQPPALRAGRMVAELFDKEVPKTAENFRSLLFSAVNDSGNTTVAVL
jgi:cyclophilin family peptidyl-prolyl cis-trans isomerase